MLVGRGPCTFYRYYLRPNLILGPGQLMNECGNTCKPRGRFPELDFLAVLVGRVFIFEAILFFL
jgi:hypothetical protein